MDELFNIGPDSDLPSLTAFLNDTLAGGYAALGKACATALLAAIQVENNRRRVELIEWRNAQTGDNEQFIIH